MSVGDWRVMMLIGLFFTTACARQPEPTPTPVLTPAPTAAFVQRGGRVTASGEIVPDKTAALGFAVAGRIQIVAVGVGDQVEAGTLLIAQEDATTRASVAEAQARLFQAEAHLAEVLAGPRAQEITAAQAELDAAKAQLAQLNEPARAEDVAAAEADLAAAEAASRQLFNGPREEERIAALATLSNAKAAVQQAQSAYNEVSWRNDVSALPESRQLQEATNNLEAAQARYDALFAQPDADVKAAAQARIQQTQAALDRLLTPGSANEIAAAEAQVQMVQARLDLLTAGAREETMAAAAATVSEAQAALQRAQAELTNTALLAPFDGVVTALTVNLGEMVQPGAVILTLADLAQMQAETTDLSERDVGRVAVGQAATVYVEALNSDLPGHVTEIAPQATIIGGDVVYTVVIALDEQPSALRWGMSVEVNILDD